MATELKEILIVLGELVGKMPDMALWILAGVGVFKLIVLLSTTGAIVCLARLAIVKLHDILTRKKIIELCVDGQTTGVTRDEILRPFLVVKSHMGYNDFAYINRNHQKFVMDAIKEKIERESDQ